MSTEKKSTTKLVTTMDAYIANYEASIQQRLNEIRTLIKTQVPEATECISYGMPAFKRRGTFIYFGAFKKHIGIYPPVTNNTDLISRLEPYRNERGNLSFAYKNELPLALIEEVIRALAEQYKK